MGAAARAKAEREFDQQRCIDLTVVDVRAGSSNVRACTRPGASSDDIRRRDGSTMSPRRRDAARGNGSAGGFPRRRSDRASSSGSTGGWCASPARVRVGRRRRATQMSAVAGFVAVAEDTARFYREFMSHETVSRRGRERARRCCAAPKQVWETLRYGTAGAGRPPRGRGARDRASPHAPAGEGSAASSSTRRPRRAARTMASTRLAVVTAVDNARRAADVRTRAASAGTVAPRCTPGSRKRCSCGLIVAFAVAVVVDAR